MYGLKEKARMHSSYQTKNQSPLFKSVGLLLLAGAGNRWQCVRLIWRFILLPNFVFQAPNQEAALCHLSNNSFKFNLILIFFQLLVKSLLFGITLVDLSKQSSQGRCKRIDRFDDYGDDDDDNEWWWRVWSFSLLLPPLHIRIQPSLPRWQQHQRRLKTANKSKLATSQSQTCSLFSSPLPVFPKPVKYMISQSRHFHTSRILPSVGIEKEDWALEIVLIQSNIFRASFVRMPVAGFDISTWGGCVGIRIYSVYRQGCLWERGSLHLIVPFIGFLFHNKSWNSWNAAFYPWRCILYQAKNLGELLFFFVVCIFLFLLERREV